MDAIDSLLNIAGLLLCLSWRSAHQDPLARSAPATLVGALKRTEPRRLTGWQLALALSCILAARALVYWLVGAPAEWTPEALVFSCLSFVRIVAVFYFWLIVLAIINRQSTEPDMIQKAIRLQLGRAAQWSWPLQVLVPFAMVMLLWVACNPMLMSLNLVDPTHSVAHLLEQGSLVGLGLFLSLKYLLPMLLLLHLITSYVYLGKNAFWDFVAATANQLTGPLRRLPLRFAKLDLSPVVGAFLILCALQWLPNLILSKLTASKVSTWPL